MFTHNPLISFIKGFDFFGESFSFKIKKQKYYTSIVGGITSLAFTIYSLYYVISNLTDFFGKNNRSIENEIKSFSESTIDFNNHDYFMMAICLRESSMAIDSKLSDTLDTKAYLVDNKLQNKRLSSNKQELEIDKCSQDYFKGALSEIYQIQDFEGCKCLRFKQKDAKFRSKYNVVDREFVQVDLKYNNKVNITNINEMNSYLEKASSKLFVYFPSFSIDVNNQLEPLKMNVHTEVYDLKPFVNQNSEILFNLLNFTDYSSLYDEDSAISLSKLSYDTSSKISFAVDIANIPTFFQLTLGLSMRSVNYTRKVLRYDDFLGNMVGYLSNIILILYIFNVIYNSFGAKVYFAEKFFMRNNAIQIRVVEELKKKLYLTKYSAERVDSNSGLDNNQNNEEINSDVKIKKVGDARYIPYVNEKQEQDGRHIQMREVVESGCLEREINNTLHSQFIKKRNTYKYNFIEYTIKNCLCLSRKKKRDVEIKADLLKNSENFYDYYLDINTYIKKMIELDFLKLFLIKNHEDLYVLDKMTPVLKYDYSNVYQDKINSMYRNKVETSETDEFIENIKEMKTTDSRVYKALLSYYE